MEGAIDEAETYVMLDPYSEESDSGDSYESDDEGLPGPPTKISATTSKGISKSQEASIGPSTRAADISTL